MAAPSLISLTESTNFRVANANKDTPSVSWQAGDYVNVWGFTGDNGQTLTAPTVSGLTLTNRITSNTASFIKLYLWTAVAAASGSGVIAGTCSNPNQGGYVVKVWRGVTALGGISSSTGTSGGTGAAHASLTVAATNSAVDGGWGDWNAVTGARTYLTTNVGAATEDNYYNDATFATVATWNNAATTATGAQTVGISAPTSTAWMIGAIELEGSAGPPPQQVRPDADVTTTGWATAPLFSKVNDQSDATVITATLA